MRRRILKHPGAVAVAALALALTAASAPAGAVTHSAVQVSGKEFYITLSRTQVKPGKLRVEFVNFGQDDHDLAIVRKQGGTRHNVGVVHPGDRGVINISTRSGTYVLWCTISDHKKKGMRATLRVKR